MQPTIQPHSWSEFPQECGWYFPFMGLVHLVIFVVGIIALGVFSRKEQGVFRRKVVRFGVFLALLLVVGSLVNGLWSCLIWGRLYWSTDYVFDFSPFWPITQSVIDAQFGDLRGALFGVTLRELQLVWLGFALGTWGITLAVYRWMVRSPMRVRAFVSVFGALLIPFGLFYSLITQPWQDLKFNLWEYELCLLPLGVGIVLIWRSSWLAGCLAPPEGKP